MARFLKLLLFLLFFSHSANAQTLEIKPAFTTLIVANIDSSINWYSNVFHLRVRNRVDNTVRGFKQAILINSTSMIELVELNKTISQDSLLSQSPQGTRIRGINKFGFTVSNIDSLYKDLLSKNVRFYGKMVTDPISNKRTFLVTDPDGNLVQFFEL